MLAAAATTAGQAPADEVCFVVPAEALPASPGLHLRRSLLAVIGPAIPVNSSKLWCFPPTCEGEHRSTTASDVGRTSRPAPVRLKQRFRGRTPDRHRA
jgi:hypothetical protein